MIKKLNLLPAYLYALLGQLNWTLCDPGDFKEYDGLTSLFIQLIKKDKELLKDGYIKRWYNLSITYAQGENN